MRVLLQRVSSASVSVDGLEIGAIDRGYVLFLGVMEGDTEAQAQALAGKIAQLRLFDGAYGKVNDRALQDVGGQALVVSQFTLAGKTERGNRPDYTAAARSEAAEPLYEAFIRFLRAAGIRQVETGRFGARMAVSLVNDGPVTLLLERESA